MTMCACHDTCSCNIHLPALPVGEMEREREGTERMWEREGGREGEKQQQNDTVRVQSMLAENFISSLIKGINTGL